MAKTITIYSTATCPHCIRLKAFLHEQNIVFTNVDVGQDRTGYDEMIKKSGQMGVPVLDIDGKIIIGFDRQAIVRELGMA